MAELVVKHTDNRKVFLDLIRVIAIFFVLYNHRATYNLAQLACDVSIETIILQSLATLCRCGVPLYLMVSGVVLLGKNEQFKDILIHRVPRILIVMIICAFIKMNGDFSLISFVDAFFTKLNWYLYAYLDYLFMLPFIRAIAKQVTEKDSYIYTYITMFLYTISGCCVFYGKYSSLLDFAPLFNSQFASICWSVIFPLSGYFIVKNEKFFSGKNLVLISAFSVLSVALSVYFVVTDIRLNNGANVDQLRVHFIYAPSLMLFCLIKVLYEKVSLLQSDIAKKTIITLSGTTFGIFLIETHTELINWLNWKLTPISAEIGEYSSACVGVLLQFLISFVIVYVLKDIPYIKKLL